MRTTWQVPQLTSDRVLQQLLMTRGHRPDYRKQPENRAAWAPHLDQTTQDSDT